MKLPDLSRALELLQQHPLAVAFVVCWLVFATPRPVRRVVRDTIAVVFWVAFAVYAVPAVLVMLALAGLRIISLPRNDGPGPPTADLDGYPTREQILAEPRLKFRPATMAFMRKWKREWRGRRRTQAALRALINGLAEIYQKPVEVRFQRHPLGPHARPDEGIIVLDPDYRSIVTALHEFAHIRFGGSELKACRWSVHLFRRFFPRTFARAGWNGHLLVVKP